MLPCSQSPDLAGLAGLAYILNCLRFSRDGSFRCRIKSQRIIGLEQSETAAAQKQLKPASSPEGLTYCRRMRIEKP